MLIGRGRPQGGRRLTRMQRGCSLLHWSQFHVHGGVVAGNNNLALCCTRADWSDAADCKAVAAWAIQLRAGASLWCIRLPVSCACRP